MHHRTISFVILAELNRQPESKYRRKKAQVSDSADKCRKIAGLTKDAIVRTAMQIKDAMPKADA